ncbi:Gag-Pol polyprotein [Araneus ventricosus]|uniref:Gag-Pol polyprotein n=1 Tax=Araneus ventricosus TaxID=182803 RepID=A0A4Y2QSH7_ARAVE|nr:Gag-Pol polyprotein [Araneus ventricosus]
MIRVSQGYEITKIWTASLSTVMAVIDPHASHQLVRDIQSFLHRIEIFWLDGSKPMLAIGCKDCQLRRRINRKDTVPITPVARPELPFQVVSIDIIGPIDPPSAKGHKYVLCLLDQHTRWAEALPLTSLTAKATCEALLTIFMRTGVPNVIASDNGTNFNASLTLEFEKRMGSSSRFSTPLHPESNGLVERFNQTLKKMLHHVILEEPRSWHTKIPFVLFAYREVPNNTTGVAPFQLLYGRKPEGPLPILKNTWMAGQEGLQLDTTPVTLYMEKLKKQKLLLKRLS